MDQSFDKTEYQLLSADLSINNFVTTFEYLNESSSFVNDSYLYNKRRERDQVRDRESS